MNLDDYLKQKTEATAKEQKELAEISKLRDEFPDLEVHVNRWNRVRFWSPSVNPIANDAEIEHNCGCCNDSPLQVTPVLLKEDGTKVYGTPEIFVGEKCVYGDKLDEGWEEKLRGKNISDVVIEKVRKYDTPDEDCWGDDDL